MFEKILGWISERWKSLVGIDTLEGQINLLTAKVKAQDDILYQVDKDKLQLAKDKIDLQAQVVVLNDTVAGKNASIESLKTEMAVQGVEVPSIKPTFLGSTAYVYRPNIQVEGEDISVPVPPDIYTRSNLLAKKVDVSTLKSLPKYAKVVKVWEYVINALVRYTGDKQDNWQLHPISILRATGDCEDGTILFLDACRMVGISASEVFNCVGNTSFGYHSYPVVFFSETEIIGTPIAGTGAGWYIFETTIDFVPAAPKKLNGSQYWCEGGLQNWLYYGNVKPENVGDFNGVAMPTSTGAPLRKRRRIENDKDKYERIKKYWRDDFVCQQK